MLTTLLSSFGGYIVAAVAALAALAGVYFKGKASGKAAERAARDAQITRQATKARTEVRNVQEEVARQGDDAVADQLKSRWVRK